MDNEIEGAQASGEPVYPHTRWINALLDEQATRLLTEAEVTAITEAHMFENLVQSAIPELRQMVKEIEPGLEQDNAKLYLAVAMKFAAGMGRDLAAMMEAKRIIKLAIARSEEDVKDVVKGIIAGLK